MLTPVMTWIDERFPMTKMVREHLTEYYAPKNFNFLYFFGGLAIVVLAIQILSGIFLKPSISSEKQTNLLGISDIWSKAFFIIDVRITSQNVPICGNPDGPYPVSKRT